MMLCDKDSEDLFEFVYLQVFVIFFSTISQYVNLYVSKCIHLILGVIKEKNRKCIRVDLK